MSDLDRRTPVLVGAGAVLQREEDPVLALEPYRLMVQALERAADDAGAPGLLAEADSVRAPRGFWDYRDPCRLVADAVGARGAHTEVAQIGVLQTTLFGRAAADIACGRADVVLVTGGEAKYRALCGQIAGVDTPLTAQADGVLPGAVLEPEEEIFHPLEVECGLVMPVTSYAMIENALRAAEGLSIDEHRREIAELWAGLSRVAADNPAAWSRAALEPREIAEPVGRNRMLAFPYTKLHTSQWNVDQAAGLILCSVEAARRAGVPEDRWVFPHCVVDANLMVPLIERAHLHRSHGFELAGARASELCGRPVGEAEHLELYSCFPAAVRVQMRELRVAAGRPVSLTGGMTFAGGPVNNFVLQAMVRMATVLRDDPGSTGVVTAVSGMITKQGVSVWSTRPSSRPFAFEHVTDRVAAALERIEVVTAPDGVDAEVVSYTIVYEQGRPVRLLLLCGLEDGRRTLVAIDDAHSAAAAARQDQIGRRVHLASGGLVDSPRP